MKTSGALGVLMLDTRFPRPVGDIGNAASFPFPVLYKTVQGASAGQVVHGDVDALLEPFIAGGVELAEAGAKVIGTSCGFLALFQDRLADALPVPVVASSLSSFGAIQRGLPEGQTVGVLTIDAEALSPRHLAAAGVSEDAAVVGLDADGPLARMIFSDDAPDAVLVNGSAGHSRDNADHRNDPVDSMPVISALVAAEMVEAGRRLVAADPAVGAVLLECTNMGPYAEALREALGLPVYGIVDILTEAMADGRG